MLSESEQMSKGTIEMCASSAIRRLLLGIVVFAALGSAQALQQPCRLLPGVRFIGETFTFRRKVPTRESCEVLCAAATRCHFFSFDGGKGHCRLKETVGKRLPAGHPK